MAIGKKRIIKHQYTIIELLVVLVIVGLLTGITMSGINGALARQGATGAVRTLATKISLAQSFAVSKNRYVALLVPDRDDVNNADLNNPTKPDDEYVVEVNNTGVWNNESFYFTKNRLCYVTKDSSGDPTVYKFDRWVEGYEWQKLPSKTIAFITQESKVDNSEPAQVEEVPDPTEPAQVEEVPDPTDPHDPIPTYSSTALIFKPSGALVDARHVIVRVFRAGYDPGVDKDHFIWQGQGTENKNKGWKIVINGFTGRSRFCLGGESIED